MKFSLFNPWPVYDVPLGGEWPVAPKLSLPPSTLDSVGKGVAIAKLADRVGFDYVTIAEHHYHPRQLSPNPFVAGAALSQHLDRAGVAILGATLPLVNPIRTAEEVSMLDSLTGGKLLLGLFRGTPNEYLTYGTNPAETRPVFEEAVDLLIQAWTQPEPFAWTGRYYDFRVVAVWPRPIQYPHPPILVSANSPKSGTHAAKNHFRIGIGFAPAKPVAAMVAHYKAEAERFGWTPPADYILHRGFCVVADTDAEAEDIVRRTSYGDMSATMARNDNGVMSALATAMAGPVPAGGPSSAPPRPPSAGRPHFVGSPDTVARQISEFADETGVGHFDLIFNDIMMPFDAAYRGAELFGTEVLPRLAGCRASRAGMISGPAELGSGTTSVGPADTIDAAVSALARGGMIIVTDDADRENEGDLVMAAQFVTEAAMSFFVRHGTGIVCVPMAAERLAELGLPLMVGDNTEIYHTAFTVSVDHVSTGTGVSAADRCATVRALADPATEPGDLRRPGHVFPLRAREGGVVRRAGHTEAALDLMKLAGLAPVGVIVEVVNDDGSMARGDRLTSFAAEHELPVVAIADLLRYRRSRESQVIETGSAEMPTVFGTFRATSYRSLLDDTEHLALVMGDVASPGRSSAGVLVRVHSECLTGDIVGSLRCDCGAQLETVPWP